MELKDQSTTKSGYSVVLLWGPRFQSGRARILIPLLFAGHWILDFNSTRGRYSPLHSALITGLSRIPCWTALQMIPVILDWKAYSWVELLLTGH